MSAPLPSVRSYLFGLDARMVPLLAIAAGLLAATGAVACYLPARRATRMHPQPSLALE